MLKLLRGSTKGVCAVLAENTTPATLTLRDPGDAPDAPFGSLPAQDTPSFCGITGSNADCCAVSLQCGCNVPLVPGLGLKVEQNSPCAAICNILAPQAHPGQPQRLGSGTGAECGTKGDAERAEKSRSRCPADGFMALRSPGHWFHPQHPVGFLLPLLPALPAPGSCSCSPSSATSLLVLWNICTILELKPHQRSRLGILHLFRSQTFNQPRKTVGKAGFFKKKKMN